MPDKQIETFYPASQKEWRNWLKKNHDKKQSIWLIMYKKDSKKPTISWSEAVDEALCFGWIDSTRRPLDEEKFIQFFAKRKLKATWSKINKDKVKRLIAEGRMTEPGLEAIKAARKNGAWQILDEAEKLTVPKDLAKEFKSKDGSKKFFMTLSKSVRKSILQWIILAKLPQTREKRIKEVAELASKGLKPKQF